MKSKVLIFRVLITLVFAFLVFYIFLPPINLSSFDFYAYLFAIIIFYFLSGVLKLMNLKDIIVDKKKVRGMKEFILLPIMLGVLVLIGLINFICSPLFNASSYSKRIKINSDNEFATDVAKVNFNAVPIVDKFSSQKLGDRVMGQMSELVSQFYVSDLYTQINYNEDIIRVTPLEYADMIKYFTNRGDGITGYIKVNSVSGEAELVKLDKGMKYMPSAMFSEDLDRHIRFKYPTMIFGEESFEIDNDGNPYWIIPTIKYTGVSLKAEISGVVILDPITGDSKHYKIDEIPSWVDHVYSANLIIEQVNDWGKYQGGVINSVFGQKGVVMTTDGYNYLAMNDDVYLYTGITSVQTDESNIGFILSNMRTKETKFYSVPGAEEYSAMASAEGQVQQMKYTASFPLLINLNDKPTYLMSLKDNAGLVKMYAFVDVVDYQKVTVTDASLGIEKAAKNYLNGEVSYDEENLITKDIVVSMINMVYIDGDSYYYIKDNNNVRYSVSIKNGIEILPFVKAGDTINISYLQTDGIIEILRIK